MSKDLANVDQLLNFEKHKHITMYHLTGLLFFLLFKLLIFGYLLDNINFIYLGKLIELSFGIVHVLNKCDTFILSNGYIYNEFMNRVGNNRFEN